MKKAQKITEEELEKNGWVYVGENFSFSKIFKKENKRLLWNPETQIIELLY